MNKKPEPWPKEPQWTFYGIGNVTEAKLCFMEKEEQIEEMRRTQWKTSDKQPGVV